MTNKRRRKFGRRRHVRFARIRHFDDECLDDDNGWMVGCSDQIALSTSA